MKKLNELQVGDQVVLQHRHPFGTKLPFQKETVEKATKTQITIAGERYNRKNGIKVGESDSLYYSVRIASSYSNYFQAMTWEEADRHNQEYLSEKEKKSLVYELEKTNFKNLNIETLRKIKDLIKESC